MQIRQVSFFLALCDEKNFVRAARRCGISQPSLSNAIKRLERELGGALFYRHHAGCRISELGQSIRPYMVELDRTARELHSHLLSTHGARIRSHENAAQRTL